MDAQIHQVFFDRFKELSRIKIRLAREFLMILADQEPKSILIDFQNENNGHTFCVVLVCFAGVVLCAMGLSSFAFSQ